MITRRLLLTGAAAAAGSTVIGCSQPAPAAIEPSQWNGTFLESGPDLPDVTLTNTAGEQMNLRQIEAPVIALFFGYTNCPDVCPGIMADMATARRRLEGDKSQSVANVLITTDPARDTPEALGAYLERVDQDFIGLTGDLDVIIDAANQVGIAIEEGERLDSGGYEVDHSSQILGFGKKRTMAVVWSLVSVGELKADLDRLVTLNQ